MKQTWRWFGPGDPVTLEDAREAGATGIVSALHDVPNDVSWTKDAVAERRRQIEAAGLDWTVVESIPVHNDIKTRSKGWSRAVDAYRASLRAVGENGIRVVCYNFIPLVDWVRTELRHRMPTGALALRFDMADFAAYDLHILGRKHAAREYHDDVRRTARARFDAMDARRRAELESVVLAGLPGGTSSYGREDFRRALDGFAELGREDLRRNLFEFLGAVLPTAEAYGIRLAIHPDDPPFDLFGLPRVVGSLADLTRIVDAYPSPSNGITFCVGSLTCAETNDVPAMAAELGEKIHFAHLRNVRREGGGSFHESDHLDGSSDMVAIVAALLAEEAARRSTGRADAEIPMRPDHGHLLLGDKAAAGVNPGYSAIGRLRGLAELRGVMAALRRGVAAVEESRHAAQ